VEVRGGVSEASTTGALSAARCFSANAFSRAVELGLSLSELLLALGLSFSSQTFLYLSLNFSLPFFLGLLLLAGAKYRQGNNHWQAKKFFMSGLDLHSFSLFEQSKQNLGRSRENQGVGADGEVAVVTITVSTCSRRKRWILA
jgi:hypothetical protein